LDLDLALQRLETMDARAAQVVELRFFGGLTDDEVAKTLGISTATVKRDWDFARSWLLSEME
jgi:RNA polymerase sigma factor (sigma-70 family)